MSATATLVKLPLETEEQVQEVTQLLLAYMNTADYISRIKKEAVLPPVPDNVDDLIDRLEVVQAAYYETVLTAKVRAHAVDSFEAEKDRANYAVVQRLQGEDGTENEKAELRIDGADMLAQLKVAVQRFHDKQTEARITQLADTVEKQVTMLTATTPELRPLSLNAQQQAAQGHGHSCQDPHHDHNAPAGGNPFMAAQMMQHRMQSPEVQRMMQMAMNTLSPSQKQFLDGVEAKMRGGSPPSAEDMQTMFGIQQHLMAVMSTLEKFSNPGGRK